MTAKRDNFWWRLTAPLLQNLTREKIIAFLKGEFVKAAVKKLLGSNAAGGFKVWLITFIVKELYAELGEPLVRFALNRVGYVYYKVEGKVLIKKLKEASNETEYDSAINDILN